MADYPEFHITTVCPAFARPIPSAVLFSSSQTDADPNVTLVNLLKKCRGMGLTGLLEFGITEDFDAVWLAGGRSIGLNVAELSRDSGLPVFVLPDGQFAGEAGGLLLAGSDVCALVCDLGQTSLKVSLMGRRWVFPRDAALLPVSSGGESVLDKGQNRRNLRRFIADSLRIALQEAGAEFPEVVVFALPAMLDKHGQPAGSSYIGMKDDTQLVPDALEMAGFPGGKVLLANDAVLAALSVMNDDRVFDYSQVLVITLGYAVGATGLDPLLFLAEIASTPGSVPAQPS